MPEPQTAPHALDPAAEQLAQRIATLLRAVQSPILTLAEAIAYTKHASAPAFSRWCSRWRVTSVSNGRYARGALDRGLHREATQRARQPKNLRGATSSISGG